MVSLSHDLFFNPAPAPKKKKYLGYFREIFLFYYENVCCVYSLKSPHLGITNEYTISIYHYFIEDWKYIPICLLILYYDRAWQIKKKSTCPLGK